MSKKLENSLLFMWFISLVATLGSLYFSEVRHYTPCLLCWYQRIFMYPLVIILFVGYLQKNARIAVTAAVFSCIGGAISLYHYCLQKVDFFTENAPACGEVSCVGQYINWFGFITIPFLALTAFILIAATSFYMMRTMKGEKEIG